MGGVTKSVLVRRPFDEVAKLATDPDVIFPIMRGFGRFDPIAKSADGSQQWDLYLDVGSIHVGGRVGVDPPSENAIAWRSLRGTRHSGRIEVSPAEGGALVTMSVRSEFAGFLTGWLTGQIANGIVGRHLEAGLEQFRHHVEYGGA